MCSQILISVMMMVAMSCSSPGPRPAPPASRRCWTQPSIQDRPQAEQTPCPPPGRGFRDVSFKYQAHRHRGRRALSHQLFHRAGQVSWPSWAAQARVSPPGQPDPPFLPRRHRRPGAVVDGVVETIPWEAGASAWCSRPMCFLHRHHPRPPAVGQPGRQRGRDGPGRQRASP